MLDRLLLGLLVAVPAADLATLVYPPAGRAGMVLWGLVWLALGVHAVCCLAATVRDVVAHRPGALTLAAAAILVTTVVVHVGDLKMLHHESTQELHGALKELQSSPDCGYTGTVLFGYPTRQLLLPVLPTVLLGHSAVCLHLGFAGCFLIALAIFARGLLVWLGGCRDGDLLTALTLSWVPHIYFFNHFMLLFEQSILPFLLGLVVVGIALGQDTRSPRWRMWLLGLATLTLAHAYTPALALLVLVEVALVVVALGKPPVWPGGRAPALLVALLVAASAAASLAYRHDLGFGGDRSPGQLLLDLLRSLRHVLVAPFGLEQLVSSYALFPMLLALAAALVGGAGWRGLGAALWVCGVFAVAVASHGYSWYEIPMRVHRFTVAFPVLLALMTHLCRTRLLAWADGRKVAIGVLAANLAIGLAFQRAYLTQHTDARNGELLAWLEPTLPRDASGRGIALYLELPPGDTRFENLWDFSQYLEPRIVHTMPIRDQGACDSARQLVREYPGAAVVVARSDAAPEVACFTAPSRRLGTFTLPGDTPVHFLLLDGASPPGL